MAMNTGSIGLKRGTVRVVPYDPDWDMSTKGVLFTMPPKKQDFGGVLAQFVDSEGTHCSVGAEAA
jgi:hypothetical protein